METEYKTATKVLKIEQDNHASNPRDTDYMDNLGKMVCTHRRYNLGDKHDFDFKAYDNWKDIERGLIRKYDAGIILPLFLYDHSGITMRTTSFNDQWDSGQVGFIYVSKADLRKEYSVKRITKKVIETAKKVLLSEVKTYDQYLTGDVYGFILTDNEGNEIDSCWGFYGSDIKTNGILDHINDNELKELLK